MPSMVANVFEKLKKDIAESSINIIDDELPFVIETDASKKKQLGALSHKLEDLCHSFPDLETILKYAII